jgi:hypothetical protein
MPLLLKDRGRVLDRGTYSARIMALTSDVLRVDEARRIALHAQGLNDRRPTGRVDRRHFRRVMDRLGLIQIDSVNVLTRSHELPFLARLGPYDRPALSAWLWGSREVFEDWAHEASLLPVDLHPLLRWRMTDDHQWKGVAAFQKSHPGLDAAILESIRELGPVTLSQLEHLGDAIKRRRARPTDMWNWSPAKRAVEWHFWKGQVSAIRNPRTFERSYVAPARVVPEAILAAPTPSADDAMKALLLRAARSHGVGTAKDLADYYRLPIVPARRLVSELTADGALRQVAVEGWKHPAFLHPEAVLPRWVRASALVSPFDPVVWERDRALRLFDFHYRIEIYVPQAKRVHGYYVLPFLHDSRLVARVDLKADRQRSRLLVRAAHAEPTWDDDRDLPALVERLREMTTFLGLGDVVVEDNGDLAPVLTTSVQG